VPERLEASQEGLSSMELTKMEAVACSETSDTSIGLLGHTSQKIVLFIVTAVRSSVLYINSLH
jgi:hypothetical protein